MYVYMYMYIYIHIYIYIYGRGVRWGCVHAAVGIGYMTFARVCPPDPMNHVKIFKGWPLQETPFGLVQLWYKSLPPGRFLPGGNVEANYVE